MKTIFLALVLSVSVVARGYAADPFSEQVTAEKTTADKAAQAKVDEAERIKEKNSITVPADLLAKMKYREWYLHSSFKYTTKTVLVLCRKEDRQAFSALGKLNKIYFVQREDEVLVLKSIVIVAEDESTKELLLEKFVERGGTWGGSANGGLGKPHAGDHYRGFLVHSGGELFPYKPGFVRDASGLFDNGTTRGGWLSEEDCRYIELVVEKTYHGDLRLPWTTKKENKKSSRR